MKHLPPLRVTIYKGQMHILVERPILEWAPTTWDDMRAQLDAGRTLSVNVEGVSA